MYVCVRCVGVDKLTLNFFPSLPVLKSAVRACTVRYVYCEVELTLSSTVLDRLVT